MANSRKRVGFNKKFLNKKKLLAVFKGLAVYTLIALAALIFFYQVSGGPKTDDSSEVPISQIVSDVKDNKLTKISIEGDKVTAEVKDSDKKLTSHKEEGESIYKIFESSGVDPKSVTIEIKDLSVQQAWIGILSAVLPILILVGLMVFLFKNARDAGQGVFSFAQSKAKLFSKDAPQIKFTDVAGAEEAKKELSEIVEFLKTPEKFKALGARIPKGVLLVGPAGTGKTLISRAVAGEAGVPFYSIAGSEFMEMLVGVGASVTGDTPILIKDKDGIGLIPIKDFVDRFYTGNEHSVVKKTEGIQTLGFDKEQNGFRGTKGKQLVFKSSAWKDVEAVYRHKVPEIYHIEYLGGKLQTTGDHSVFVRTHGGIMPKKASELKKGDLLVELPLNVKHWDDVVKKTIHRIKTHLFEETSKITLDFWEDDESIQYLHQFVLQNPDKSSSYRLASETGVCQTTVLNWQKGVHFPQVLSKKLVKLNLPDQVSVTCKLMKLFGFYTAEGRGTGSLEFTFGSHEPAVYGDCIDLMEDVFGVKPVVLERKDHSVKINYYSHHLGRFFARFCGNGSHNKHIPEILWLLPKKYFLAFLEGYSRGDGYITKSGKLCMSSVSHQLIKELAWLCSMHGIKVGIKHERIKGGRIILDRPLPDGEFWTLIIGKTSNPFLPQAKYPNQFKRAIVKKVTKKKYHGFVYDLCGVENEAFFGGEKPVLLHNSRVRDMFAQAKKNSPSIIFIDEIESIGRQRGMGFSGGHDEREQTLNQILVEMDGFTPNERVIILAATNRPDLLDAALIRPGRFDRRVVVSMPDLQERKAIIELHMKGKPFTKNVDPGKLARRTVGFSGADLANMLNEAAILAAREDKTAIDNHDLEEAATKEKLGPQRKRMQSEQDRNLAAYHEAGHAIVGHFLKKVDPLHRISIISRGLSGGHTLFPPTQDRSNESKSRLLEQITAALGGQAAEELTFKDISTGAASDIEIATNIARHMVTEYGMSSLGPINVNPRPVFGIWRGMKEGVDLSPKLHNAVDCEVRKITDSCFKAAQDILRKHRVKLDAVAKALLEKETLEGDEFEKIVGKKKSV
ncbi:AAA family ATPase [Patescibacteria group bacterium]|nr:AAA family ATPase [Patescibacteria group bacterium]